MALFKRVNLKTLSLLNHCYNKFATSTVKLNTEKPAALYNNYKKLNKQNEKTGIFIDKTTPFEFEITRRRSQACRSILVQVLSLDSREDLQYYCSKFGMIQNIYHYNTDKQRHFMLIEFKDKASVNEIISHASFMNTEFLVPVKSSVLWFHKKISQNSNQKSQKELMLGTNSLYPNLKEIIELLYHSNSISEQIQRLYDTLKLNDLEVRLRFYTAHHLEQYFSELFYGIKILPFGSTVNSFGTKRCDLDLVLVTNDVKELNEGKSRLIFYSKFMRIKEKHEGKEFMTILASIMQHFIPGINNVRKILEARVPIIKFNFECTCLECDLTTTNMTAVYMSELLNLYGEIDWRVRPLVLVIRQWAKMQEITNDSPGPWITNFSLSLLVLFYLQQKNILPSSKTLKKYALRNDIRFTDNGVNCTFLRDIKKLPSEHKNKLNKSNLEDILFGFFEFYSIYDFYTRGICIHEGIPVRKPSHSALHIVNPFEATLNVSKNVSIYELNRLKEKAHDAVFILETSDKVKGSNWGLMKLLKLKGDFDINISQHDIEENRNVTNESQKNYSHEILEKIVNDDDIQPKKEETV